MLTMKQSDILKEIAKPTFKLLLAQDIESVRLSVKTMISDIKDFNTQAPNLISEETLTGLKNVDALLNIYTEQLITQSEDELTSLASKLGESE